MPGLAQAGQSQTDSQTVQQVMLLLTQGANPDELLAQGVPAEVIELAMQGLQAQAAQQQGLAQGPTGGGIAQAQGLAT